MRSPLWSCAGAMMLPAVASAVLPGQIETFQGGLNNWTSNFAYSVLPYGGPSGAGDQFLKFTSNGSTTPAGTLSTQNVAQWAGNYAAAGVTGIEADLINLDAFPLQMRVLIKAGNYGDFTSTTAFSLPGDSRWHHVVFGLTAADLTWGGIATGDLSEGLKYIDTLMFRHQSGPPLGIGSTTPIEAAMGIDNIHLIPEPAANLLMILGSVPMLWRRSSVWERVKGVL